MIRTCAALPGTLVVVSSDLSHYLDAPRAEALDEALCYGWIDSQKKSYDQDTWLQKFTPRGPKMDERPGPP